MLDITEKPKANGDFMRACQICGKQELILSQVSLIANYGSEKHEGERLVLGICGGCVDRLYDTIEAMAAEN